MKGAGCKKEREPKTSDRATPRSSMAQLPKTKPRGRADAEARLGQALAKYTEMMRIAASQASLAEILYFLDGLHVLRTRRRHAEDLSTAAVEYLLPRLEDIQKYIALCVASVGRATILDPFNGPLIQELAGIANHLHKLAEIHSLLPFADAQLVDNALRDIRLDFATPFMRERDFVVAYFIRLEQSTARSRKEFRTLDEILANFASELEGVEAQFEQVSEMSVEEFCAITRAVAEKISERLSRAEIDQQPYVRRGGWLVEGAIMIRARTLVWRRSRFTADELLNRWLRFLQFEPASFSIGELWFDRSQKGPVLVLGDWVVISPELLLDGLSATTRDRLLSNSRTRHAYQTAMSESFLGEVSAVFEAAGFVEIDALRNYEVMVSEEQPLGDIDRAYTDGRTTFVVEGKNHVLPISVYYKEEVAVLKRLAETQPWVEKVRAREAELRRSPPRGLNENFKSIIVTRDPEILAHCCDIPVVSKSELGEWLQTNLSFTAFLASKYALNAAVDAVDLQELDDIAVLRAEHSARPDRTKR